MRTARCISVCVLLTAIAVICVPAHAKLYEENSVVGWWQSNYAAAYGDFGDVWAWDATNVWHDGKQTFEVKAEFAAHNHKVGLVKYDGAGAGEHTELSSGDVIPDFTSPSFGLYMTDTNTNDTFYTDPNWATSPNPGTYEHNAWVFSYTPMAGKSDLREYVSGSTYLVAWEDLVKNPRVGRKGWDPTVARDWGFGGGSTPQWYIDESQESSRVADNNDVIMFWHSQMKFGSPPVPEPASCALLALAVGGVGVGLKKRRRK